LEKERLLAQGEGDDYWMGKGRVVCSL
jgi:hypothetical protein